MKSSTKVNLIKDRNKYYFHNEFLVLDKLENKNYYFAYNTDTNDCWLEDSPDFKMPDKIYNTDEHLISMIINDFKLNNKNLGVLLTGNKGQGKSFSAKQLCLSVNVPTIIIPKSIPLSIDFVTFLSKIKQDYILFVDEFEKLFPLETKKEKHTQKTFLSFMDGVLTTTENKILFLLTCNDEVSEYFINRPSRIKFLKEYEELDEKIFNEIIDDRLINKSFKKDLEDNISLVNINIDLLIEIIETINQHNKPFSSFSDIFNYKFEASSYLVYIIDGNKEEFHKYYNPYRKIKYNETYIADFDVNRMIDFKKDEITFESFIHGEDGEKTVIIKLVKINNNIRRKFTA